jgi:hypothetical protein
MTVVFLDLDGVLCTDKEFFMSQVRFQSKHEWAKELNVQYPFNPGCVNIFNELSDLVDFKVVLSSDWKDHYNLDKLNTIFVKNGVKMVPMAVTHSYKVDLFSTLEDNRHFQIMSWVNKHKPDKWLVLDDLDMTKHFEASGFLDNFFLTKSSEGLKKTGLKNKILNKIK